MLPVLPAGTNPVFCVPYYKDTDGKIVLVPFSVTQDGRVIFIAPISAVYYVMLNSGTFSDIRGHWAENDMLFAIARGLFKGIGSGRFDPEGTMNRAMLVSVLYRMAGEPKVTEGSFRDVFSGTWYTNAVSWASQNGLVNGYNNERFGPMDEMTREQLVTILYRFMSLLGRDTGVGGNLSVFKDSGKVSMWAKDAMEWAVGTGLLQGYDGYLSPGGNATRAQSSTIFRRFINLVILGKV
jgi:hypothetical protein